jgi:hypothetical protein
MKQANSGKLVVVEPDMDVWHILAKNQYLHHCNFWTYRGVISEYPMTIQQAAYATRSTPASSSSSHSSSVSARTLSLNLNLLQIQELVGFSFTVLLIDCEGCLNYLFYSHHHQQQQQYLHIQHLLTNITTIILEADMKRGSPVCKRHCVDYERWYILFQSLGYQLVYKKVDDRYIYIDHVVFQKQKLKTM